ncbi:alpha/beta fold hydrolase [Reinekea blandensis]|uniref:GPI inositol-deacylase PGAP1-like alpha/beta domain-containing protein n=1 Tax=Reinekea blandensis MED297 TaxID=314283 RepID=A4BJ41_9GAMM|nr:alpha/beta fold hydrolase [Reinekea blandensis]EAR07886.1 hypothetical protein MED297_08701 [Reinekea sp. MED297] [Reinekea blandensis MED297]
MSADRLPLKAVSRLTREAVVAMTDLVESLHATITQPVSGSSSAPHRTRGITGMVYRNVRRVATLSGRSAEQALGQLDNLIDSKTPSPVQRHLRAALNGVIGDYLEQQGSPLAIPMTFRQNGQVVTDEALAPLGQHSTTPVVLFIHGLCMHDEHWSTRACNYPKALTQTLNLRVLYLHYNSGRSILDNGDELSQQLNRLFASPDKTPPLILIGHSMGGLVARRACYTAQKAQHPWVHHLDSVITLGTPHFGAPLAQAGALLERLLEKTPYSAPFARLAKLRSQGIKDLRHGRLVGPEPRPYHPDPSQLPEGVRMLAVAASLTGDNGDGLVPVQSALGEHRDPDRSLPLADSDKLRIPDCGHLDLLGHPQIEKALLEWLSPR